MADIWMGAALIIGILLVPILIPIAYFFINPDSFRQYGVWIWLGTGVVELILLFLMVPLVL